MTTKTDQSYGVIPYVYDKGVLKFFLIYQHSHWRGDRYWIFPKGHAEENEKPEETALRELAEETQLILESLNNTVIFDLKYDFTHGDIQVKKTSSFFLGEAASQAYTLDGHEVTQAGWFTHKEARECLTHEGAKKLLDEVVDYLRTVPSQKF